ncbi:hypothetical protein [Candidatus Megaera venefica]|uniref:hypothetical protein n=1 Tax=Candidatus Megaera venefica TaxID=2055910 RepID=UPI002AD222F7|nr:hypothetical protein [Candidatus Megaera venefica]
MKQTKTSTIPSNIPARYPRNTVIARYQDYLLLQPNLVVNFIVQLVVAKKAF